MVVGGLFGKVLTGPWMTAMYRKAYLRNLASSVPLTKIKEKLVSLIEHPRLLFDASFCCLVLPVGHARNELSKKVHERLLGYEV